MKGLRWSGLNEELIVVLPDCLVLQQLKLPRWPARPPLLQCRVGALRWVCA